MIEEKKAKVEETFAVTEQVCNFLKRSFWNKRNLCFWYTQEKSSEYSWAIA